MKVVEKKQKQNKTEKPKKGIWKTIVGVLAILIAFLIVFSLISDFASPNQYTKAGEISQTYTVLESEGGTYFGQAQDLAYEGSGEFQYLSGGFYEGEFSDSVRSGEGVFYFENGDSISGTWENDKIISGEYSYADGRSFEGTFTNDSFESGSFDGAISYVDGSSYLGSIDKAKRGGIGTYTWPNGDEYSGTWENDKMLVGTYTFSDGRRFVGTFSSSSYNTGKYTLNDLASEKGFSSFTAIFTDGIITGYDFETTNGLKYKGDVTGTATIVYTTGNTYSGDVKQGVRSGTGAFKWISSSKIVAYYEGAWVEGAMSGSGTYHYSSENYPYITGTFVSGKPDGTATYYKEAGNTFSTTWSNGSCSKVTET